MKKGILPKLPPYINICSNDTVKNVLNNGAILYPSFDYLQPAPVNWTRRLVDPDNIQDMPMLYTAGTHRSSWGIPRDDDPIKPVKIVEPTPPASVPSRLFRLNRDIRYRAPVKKPGTGANLGPWGTPRTLERPPRAVLTDNLIFDLMIQDGTVLDFLDEHSILLARPNNAYQTVLNFGLPFLGFRTTTFKTSGGTITPVPQGTIDEKRFVGGEILIFSNLGLFAEAAQNAGYADIYIRSHFDPGPPPRDVFDGLDIYSRDDTAGYDVDAVQRSYPRFAKYRNIIYGLRIDDAFYNSHTGLGFLGVVAQNNVYRQRMEGLAGSLADQQVSIRWLTQNFAWDGSSDPPTADEVDALPQVMDYVMQDMKDFFLSD